MACCKVPALADFEGKQISLNYLVLLDARDFLLLHDKILTGKH